MGTRAYEAALVFATKKHEGQTRIGGEPYISHPVAVANILREQGYDEATQIAGLFHDLLEDTDATEEEIRALGGEDVLTAVKLLSKQKGYVMAEYIAGIRNNPMAFAIKGADRLHNLRSALVAGEDFKRKYVLESLDWYLDFLPEIPGAIKALAQSMATPLSELSFLYEPGEDWLMEVKKT